MRTELDVPFSHKEEAKALGAKWDRTKKIWYVPSGVTPEPFAGVKEYGDSAITYVLQVWSSAPDYWTTYFTVNEAFSREPAQDGIEMTYPHLNVHPDSNP